MYRNWYRRLNYLIYILIVLLAVVLESTIFNYFPFNWLHPDTVFILSVYLGLRKDLVTGGSLVVIAALIAQANSGAHSHILLTTYLYVFLLAKLLSHVLAMRNILTSSFSIGAFLFVLKQIGIFILFSIFGKQQNVTRHILVHLVPGLITQLALMPVLFSAFHTIDLKTYTDEHSEDELDLNKGI